MTAQGSDPRSSTRWRDRWLEPHPRIARSEDRHAARLFALIMLLQLAAITIGLVVTDLAFRFSLSRTILTSNDGRVILAGVGLIVVAYGLLRAGLFLPGIGLYIAVTAVVALVAPFVGTPDSEMTMLGSAIFPVLLTAMVFSYRWVIAVIVAVVGIGVVEIAIHPLPPRVFASGVAMLVVVFVGSVMVLVFKHFLGLLERDRLEALRQSELNYKNLFETVADGIFIVSAGGRVLEVNSAACQQLGYSREELLALSLDDVIGQPEHARWAAEVLRSRISSPIETSHRRKDGTRIPVELTVSAVTHHGEQAFLEVARDISERHRVAEEKKALEVQIHQAVKMESLGRMAGGVAHDFNNLLTAILGNVDMASLSLDKNDQVSGVLDEIRKAASSAAVLTRQLLTFSRKQIIEPREVNLNELVARAEKLLGRLLREDITLTVVLGADVGAVRVDPAVIEQVIVNLAVNARDAMPRGGSLSIETKNADLDRAYVSSHPLVTPGRYVMIAVSDTGEGMSAETKQHLFEPFYSTKPLGHGTGLGLATSYGTVRQSGGTIEVYSELGRGTTFRIYLPRIDAPVRPADEEPSPRPLPRGTETVLVVEDEAVVRDFASSFLSNLGYTALTADCAEAALKRASEHAAPIHLLLTDVVLPGLDGRQLAERLKALHPETKVLFTSGYTANIIAQHGVLDEGIAFIHKPYLTSELAARIRDVLDCADREG